MVPKQNGWMQPRPTPKSSGLRLKAPQLSSLSTRSQEDVTSTHPSKSSSTLTRRSCLSQETTKILNPLSSESTNQPETNSNHRYISMRIPKGPNSTKPVEGPQSPSTVHAPANPYRGALDALEGDTETLKRDVSADLTRLMQKVAKYRKSKRRKDEMGFKDEPWYIDTKEDIRVRSMELKRMELKLLTLRSRVSDGI